MLVYFPFSLVEHFITLSSPFVRQPPTAFRMSLTKVSSSTPMTLISKLPGYWTDQKYRERHARVHTKVGDDRLNIAGGQKGGSRKRLSDVGLKKKVRLHSYRRSGITTKMEGVTAFTT